MSPHGRARASGPAAPFALRAVFEAAALIYVDVYDVLKPFSQKVRGSRGRDPRSRRWAAVTSVHALVRRWAPLLLFRLLRSIFKKIRRFDVCLFMNAVDFFQNDRVDKLGV